MVSPPLPEVEEVVEEEVGVEEGEQEPHSPTIHPAGRGWWRRSKPPGREGHLRQPQRISMEVINVNILKELPNVTFVVI